MKARRRDCADEPLKGSYPWIRHVRIRGCRRSRCWLTASGEAFNMNALTAAHPTLPFGTRLRVVNLDNDREVEVRVNDRGPSTPGRMLDLSYAAARALGAVGAGVIPVRATVLSSN